ncbi:hypothetical protein DFH07DRAFT_1005775 [Mycena maculata]|uniref:Uncharacterized protein n=1 Tax=Mycena maculata TaxID=230809 RepID=A0AAD7NPK7_9AGAR|nr:hypothetical protein DFH07DRAFT_1005775 [Mycena maculata]
MVTNDIEIRGDASTVDARARKREQNARGDGGVETAGGAEGAARGEGKGAGRGRGAGEGAPFGGRAWGRRDGSSCQRYEQVGGVLMSENTHLERLARLALLARLLDLPAPHVLLVLPLAHSTMVLERNARKMSSAGRLSSPGSSRHAFEDSNLVRRASASSEKTLEMLRARLFLHLARLELGDVLLEDEAPLLLDARPLHVVS